MTAAPMVDSVNIKVTYKGGNALEMDVGIPVNAVPAYRAQINETVNDLLRLLMEASE